jgi:hypothetical protein
MDENTLIMDFGMSNTLLVISLGLLTINHVISMDLLRLLFASRKRIATE